ncbi:cupin domain-containing protein [Yinghuangia aomiensis]
MIPEIPEAVHAGAEDVPWVENIAYPGTMMRLLRADLHEGTYVMAGRLPAGLAVGTHRHAGAVHMFTLSGAWGYREHGFVNRAGSYLYEPPGSTHVVRARGQHRSDRDPHDRARHHRIPRRGRQRRRRLGRRRDAAGLLRELRSGGHSAAFGDPALRTRALRFYSCGTTATGP